MAKQSFFARRHAIGTRPVDLHLFALKKLGAKIKIKDGYIIADAKKGLKGTELNSINFCGCYRNALLASYNAKGNTVLKIAIEPEVEDLISFLKKLGANIKISGRTIHIFERVKEKLEIKHEVMFDRIKTKLYNCKCFSWKKNFNRQS